MFVLSREGLRYSLLVWCTLIACNARADSTSSEFSPQVWINPGIYSQHFDRSKNLRNNNAGLGAEVALTKDHGFMVGTYINSNRAHSNYGTYVWRPLHWNALGLNVSAGLAAGAFDGYPNYRNGGWFLAALPVLSIEGERVGVNLSILPTIPNRIDGAIAIQFKLRIW